MTPRKIDLYILRETLGPLLVGIFVFSFILLSGKALTLADMIVTRGVPAMQVGKLLFFLLPSFLMFTTPLAFLLAALMAIGRLSADGEITALKASGVSLPTIARPIFLLACMTSAATAFLTLHALPDSHSRFRNLLFQTAQQNATLSLQAGRFNENFNGLTIYAETVDDKLGRLSHVFISDGRQPDAPSIITANQGQLVSEPEQRRLLMRLQDGSIHRPKPGTSEVQSIRFSAYDIGLDLKTASTAELNRPVKDKELGMSALLDRFNGPHDVAARIEFHRRLALPAAPIIFALVAIPLGLINQRAGKGAGLTTALATFLGYYLLYSLAKSLAEAGLFWPGPAMWFANTVLLIIGLYLFRQALLERPLWPEWLIRTSQFLRHGSAT